jgi:hypothetical protein
VNQSVGKGKLQNAIALKLMDTGMKNFILTVSAS